MKATEQSPSLPHNRATNQSAPESVAFSMKKQSSILECGDLAVSGDSYTCVGAGFPLPVEGRGRALCCVMLAAVLLLSTLCTHAQIYSIDWHTIDGGGGTSTGGVYSVSGTIGQPDAGTLNGSGYTLNGGFWGLLSIVHTPSAPLLTIVLTATNTAIVSWPSPSSGFVLQQNTNTVPSLNWSNVSAGIQDNGTNKYLIVNPPAGNRYYRLFKP